LLKVSPTLRSQTSPLRYLADIHIESLLTISKTRQDKTGLIEDIDKRPQSSESTLL
jgi:hypothetical protein